MADCPRCRGRALAPTLLAAGLSAKGCSNCGGALVDLLAYRAWAEHAGAGEPGSGANTSIEIDDTGAAISCPNCSAIMTKFRPAASAANKLDFCSNCDEVWLDAGEWKQLEDLGLREKLGTVFTEPWQRHVREELAELSREAVLRRRFGSDFERIADVRKWVLNHPQREYILAWLADRRGH